MKKLSVIIVNYNVCYFLEQALFSVRKALLKLNEPSEIFVVDNNSADSSVEMVKERFPEVILIQNKQNLGFAKANNQAIKKASGAYLLLLNPDTVIEEDTLLKCCQFMDAHSEAGGLGVKMVNGSGTFLPESKRGLPTPLVSFYKMAGLAFLFPKSEKYARYYLGHLDKNKIHEVDVLSGAFMFLRKSVLNKIGLLDEAFFMYGEDVDLSYRILKAGYKNYYFPKTSIIHYKGESTRRSSINYVYVFYNAMAIFYRKHFSGRTASAFSLFIQVAIVIRAGISVLARMARSILPFLDDAALLFAGLYGIRMLYDQKTGSAFSLPFMTQVLPVAVTVWLSAIYFNGGYDKPFGWLKLVRGILAGAILNAALATFWQNSLFPASIIWWGSVWAVVGLLGKRLIYHYGQYQDFRLGDRPRKRMAIIGEEQESKRVLQLLRKNDLKTRFVGTISPHSSVNREKEHLGDLTQINDIIQIYKISELLFCGKDLSVAQVIQWIVAINNSTVQYRILPVESELIIDSPYTFSQNNYYGLPIELNFFKKVQVRNKRLLDVIVAFLFLLFSPVLVWLVNSKAGFIKNCLLVLSGSSSWVGLKTSLNQTFPRKKYVLTPVDRFRESNNQDITEFSMRQIEILYAQTYSIKTDLEIIVKGFPLLGRAV